MSPYKFSPIKTREELLEAIKYTHSKGFELCGKAFGRNLPVAGNIGVFCHYDEEYKFLTRLREKLTDNSDNWNQKYFRLHQPIVIPAKAGVPGTTYTYLYIRKPDQHAEVGDVDFVMPSEEHRKLKDSSLAGNKINDVEISYRPDLDMVRLSNPAIDALAYISTRTMAENTKA